MTANKRRKKHFFLALPLRTIDWYHQTQQWRSAKIHCGPPAFPTNWVEASTTTVVDLDFIGKHLKKAAPQQFQRMSCPFTILRGVRKYVEEMLVQRLEEEEGGEWGWVEYGRRELGVSGGSGGEAEEETCLPVRLLWMFNLLIGNVLLFGHLEKIAQKAGYGGVDKVRVVYNQIFSANHWCIQNFRWSSLLDVTFCRRRKVEVRLKGG